MIKISANVSKKVPIEGLEYSSQSFSAGMECEVSGSNGKEELMEKIRKLYALLEEAIDEQIRGHTQGGNSHRRLSQQTRQNLRRRARQQDGNGNGKTATTAQIKAIHAIAGDRGMDKDALKEYLLNEFRVDSAKELNISEASQVIDALKSSKKG